MSPALGFSYARRLVEKFARVTNCTLILLAKFFEKKPILWYQPQNRPVLGMEITKVGNTEIAFEQNCFSTKLFLGTLKSFLKHEIN